jgi:biotin operon repressor
MIERRTIFEIHRLASEGLSVRKIAATLGLSRLSVQKYLDRIRISFFRVPILPCCGEPDE